MFFIVLSSSSCSLGFEVSVLSSAQVKGGEYLLATNPDLDDACHQADNLHHACKLYKWATVDGYDEFFAQAVSGLTKDMIKKLEKVLDA